MEVEETPPKGPPRLIGEHERCPLSVPAWPLVPNPWHFWPRSSLLGSGKRTTGTRAHCYCRVQGGPIPSRKCLFSSLSWKTVWSLKPGFAGSSLSSPGHCLKANAQCLIIGRKIERREDAGV